MEQIAPAIGCKCAGHKGGRSPVHLEVKFHRHPIHTDIHGRIKPAVPIVVPEHEVADRHAIHEAEVLGQIHVLVHQPVDSVIVGAIQTWLTVHRAGA